MQIDRASLERLLSLNDRQFSSVITRLIAQSGIDPAEFQLNTKDVESLRKALAGASDDDLRRIAEQYEASQRKRR